MTDNIENIDLDSLDYADAPQGLREYAKSLKSQLADARKQVNTYQDAALGTVLTQAGFANPNRVKEAIRADKVDIADAAKVNEWIALNGNDFARGANAPAIPEPQQELPDYSAQAAAQHQMHGLQQVAAPSGGRSPLEAAQSEVTASMSGREVLEVLRRHGV